MARTIKLSDLTAAQVKALKQLEHDYPTSNHHIDGRTGNALQDRKLVTAKWLASNTVKAFRISPFGRRLLSRGRVVVP